MAYKGSIRAGSQVVVELQVSGAAAGTGLLAISFADNGGGSGSDSVLVAPGAAGQSGVTTNAGVTGLLRVWVDMNGDADTGRLIVSVNGTIRNNEPITGDTTWSYSLS